MDRLTNARPIIVIVLVVLLRVGNLYGYTFTNIADTTTVVPGHGGTFSSFGTPTISGSNVAFMANFSGGSGIYTGTVGMTGANRVADTTTAVPGQSGTFNSFSTMDGIPISGSNIAFNASYNLTTGGTGSGLYTGTAGVTGANRLADGSTAIPGRTGTFVSFAAPSISGSNVSFTGSSSGGSGIYAGTVGTIGASLVADMSTAVPGHSGTFNSLLLNGGISGNTVAFTGGYSGGSGIYTGTVGTTGASLVADASTVAPGQSTTFGTVYATSISGSNVAFAGTFSGGSGIYLATVGTTGAVRVADTTTAVPGHFGTFSSFTSRTAISGNNVAFGAAYSGGSGVFLETGGTLFDVVDKGSTLFGSTISSVYVGSDALDGSEIVFSYVLANGTSGLAAVFVDTAIGGGGGQGVPEPPTWIGGVVLFSVALFGGLRRLHIIRA